MKMKFLQMKIKFSTCTTYLITSLSLRDLNGPFLTLESIKGMSQILVPVWSL